MSRMKQLERAQVIFRYAKSTSGLWHVLTDNTSTRCGRWTRDMNRTAHEPPAGERVCKLCRPGD